MLRWWRQGLLVAVLVVDGLTAAHWSWSAFGASLLFAAAPVLAWLSRAPSTRDSVIVGGVLLCLSVVPGLVFGPGGLTMYRVSAAGLWTGLLYEPVALLVVAVGLVVVGLRRPLVPLILVGALTASCLFFETGDEDGQTRVLPNAAVVGMLPGDLHVLAGPRWDGGSSVESQAYDVGGRPGADPRDIAVALSRYLAGVTGWDVPTGYSDQCYRAASVVGYGGRYCASIQPSTTRDGAVTFRLAAWDNRFGEFSPSPG